MYNRIAYTNVDNCIKTCFNSCFAVSANGSQGRTSTLIVNGVYVKRDIDMFILLGIGQVLSWTLLTRTLYGFASWFIARLTINKEWTGIPVNRFHSRDYSASKQYHRCNGKLGWIKEMCCILIVWMNVSWFVPLKTAVHSQSTYLFILFVFKQKLNQSYFRRYIVQLYTILRHMLSYST